MAGHTNWAIPAHTFYMACKHHKPKCNVCCHKSRIHTTALTTLNPAVQLLVELLGEEMASEQNGGPPMPLTVVFVERKTRCVRTAIFPEVAAALHPF